MRDTPDNDTPINQIDQAYREARAATDRAHEAMVQVQLSLLRTAAAVILEADEQPPAERDLQLVRVAYDQLVELRERVAKEPWLSEADILREPLTTVEELIDLAREMLA